MLISVCKKVLNVTYHLLAECCLDLSAALFLCKKGVFHLNVHEFICQNVSVSQIKRPCCTPRRRAISTKFSFKIEHTTIRVCKKFFLKTLDIGKKTVDYALKKQQNGTFQETDMRGKMLSANKTPEERVNGVCKHIESFPTVETHYTRKGSKRQYLNWNTMI